MRRKVYKISTNYYLLINYHSSCLESFEDTIIFEKGNNNITELSCYWSYCHLIIKENNNKIIFDKKIDENKEYWPETIPDPNYNILGSVFELIRSNRNNPLNLRYLHEFLNCFAKQHIENSVEP